MAFLNHDVDLHRDLPSIALHSLATYCQKWLGDAESHPIPFDDGVLEARVLMRPSLVVGVRPRVALPKLNIVGLYLEQKGPGEILHLAFRPTGLPQGDGTFIWFTLNDPPELVAPFRTTHVLAVTDPPTF